MATGENVYDEFAAAYAEDNADNATNALYERPASLALLGDVRGQRVLDAGCGPGTTAAELVARGAQVTGLDSSTGLLAIARERLGPTATVLHADLAEPLPLPDNGFDAVLGSLVLHYLRDWVPTRASSTGYWCPAGDSSCRPTIRRWTTGCPAGTTTSRPTSGPSTGSAAAARC